MRQEARIDYVATQPTAHRDSMIVRHLIRAAPREKTVIQRMLDVAKCAVVAGAFMLGAEACNTPQSMSATLVGSPGLADERTSSVRVTAGALRTELLAFADEQNAGSNGATDRHAARRIRTGRSRVARRPGLCRSDR